MKKENPDFIYEDVYLKRPDGSLLKACRVSLLPLGEKGKVANFIENMENIECQANAKNAETIV
jgi:hypothetical protein